MKKVLFIILFLPFICYSQWTQIGQDIIGEENNFGIGGTVKLNANGNVVALGSFYEPCNCAYVYENINDNWVQKGQTIYHSEDGVYQLTLNENGDILVINTWGFDQNLFIYQFNGSEWVNLGDLSNLNFELEAIGYYPIDINHSGDIVAFGGYGGIHVIKNNNGIWEQLGQTIDEGVGSFVRLSSDGQTLFATGSNQIGKVFKLINNIWEQIGSDISGAGIQITAADISSDGSTLLIKNTNFNKEILKFSESSNDWEPIFELFSPAPYANLNGSGNIFISTTKVYQNQNGNFTQLGLDLDMSGVGGFIETSINDVGNIVAAGAELYDENKGLVRVFRYDGDLSIHPINLESNISFYPNPIKDILYFSDFVKNIIIYDLSGKIVLMFKDLTNQIDTSNLINGNYIMNGNTKNGKNFSFKIIKAK